MFGKGGPCDCCRSDIGICMLCHGGSDIVKVVLIVVVIVCVGSDDGLRVVVMVEMAILKVKDVIRQIFFSSPNWPLQMINGKQ